MGTLQLTEKQQELLVLCITEQCLKFAEDNGKTFEEVLNEDLFPAEANTEFAEFICKNIKALNDKGYISGTVELEYELEINQDTLEEISTDAIDFAMCTFENISISLKGKAQMGVEKFKETGKDFAEKAKPVIKGVTTIILQTMIEQAVVTGMKAAGFPIVS